MTAFDNSLRRQSYSIPGLLGEIYPSLDEQARQLAGQYRNLEVNRVIVTGCGDSNAAAMAMRHCFWEITGIPAEVVTVLDFSRCYPAGRLDGKTLVVIVSVSGNGARIEEAAVKARTAGALVLAVTKNADSGIGRIANYILGMEISAFERGPGNRNYFASVLALLVLAVRMGQVAGRLTEAQVHEYRADIFAQTGQLEQQLPEMDRQLFEISGQWVDFVNFDFVGAGDDYVNAWFGHAKVIEAVGAFATHNNAEEWFHMNNFYRNIRQCGTLFFAAKGSPGISRTREAVQYAARIGRPVLVITDEQPAYFAADVYYVSVPSGRYPAVSLLTHYLPSCLLAGYIGARKGERNCRGCLDEWEFAAGGRFIRESEMAVYEN